MTNVNNPQAIKELVSAANLQVGFDEVPSKLANSIVPVININPKQLRIANISAFAASNASGAITIYSVPTTQDFYLTGIQYTLAKDVTCDMATGQAAVTIAINGKASRIIDVGIITLTAQQYSISREFNPPIKIDKGYVMATTTNAYTAGTCSRTINILGYSVENNQ